MGKREQGKQRRLKIINQLIIEIGSRGRRFFYYKPEDRFAYMKFKNNKVFFVDDYTNEEVYAYNTVFNNHSGLSHGGTMWALINDFREFIVTGEYSDGNNGYGGLYCPHWGYPEEDMIAIREKARELGYLKYHL